MTRFAVFIAVVFGPFGLNRLVADPPNRLAMIEQIDQRLASRWAAEQIQPAARARDQVFFRRVYLDLTGAIPRVSQVRAFLADPSDHKRQRIIDELLDSPAHATHMAIRWRNIMLQEQTLSDDALSAAGLQRWFRDQFVENMRYDRIVSDFLVATGSGQTGPALFYTSLEVMPEKLAAATSRVFLGTQIECAQCHDHPFDHWKQTDFWGYAAFFARLRQADNASRPARIEDLATGEVMLPDTQDVVLPKFPGGEPADPDDLGTRREQLAIWMASRNNPYLARAAVNRTWAHLFGRGLVEPVDDLGPHNPPSHPELLDELASYFVRTKFDLRELYATLSRTEAYQRSSRPANDPPAPPKLFNRMALKTLSPDQLYDSLNRILVRPPPANVPGTVAVSRQFEPRRQMFLSKIHAESTSPSRYDAGVTQALTLMNGGEIREATNLQQSGVLGSLDAPFLTNDQRVEILFLATLSRYPSDEEHAKFETYVRQASQKNQLKSGLADVLWALLNSAEFRLNH